MKQSISKRVHEFETDQGGIKWKILRAHRKNRNVVIITTNIKNKTNKNNFIQLLEYSFKFSEGIPL